MKTDNSYAFLAHWRLWAAFILLFLTLPAQSQTTPLVPGKGPAREVISEADLQKAVAGTKKISELLKDKGMPLSSPRPNLEHNLYSQSIILFDGQFHTVLPLGSILSLPPQHQLHVIANPMGDFTYWPAFKVKNAAWVEGYEIPLKMAKGDEGESRKVLKEIKDNPKILVSTFKNCPISVLEPVAPGKVPPPAKQPVIGQSSK